MNTMPKYELHRHLGGSLSLDFVNKHLGITNAAQHMTFGPNEPYSFKVFLKKFDILNRITWDQETIEDSIHNVYQGILNEHIQYCELKISVHKYLNLLTPDKAISIIYDIIQQLNRIHNIKINIVLSLKYESDKEEQIYISRTILEKVPDKIVAVDLVGDEKYFDVDFYSILLKDWHDHHKGVEAHVGESQSHENVMAAIQKLKVTRIAHGIKAAKHPDIMRMANDQNVCFDIALKSNLYHIP